MAPGQRFSLDDGLEAELFMVPGKLPLYLEGEEPDTASETAANVGSAWRLSERAMTLS